MPHFSHRLFLQTKCWLASAFCAAALAPCALPEQLSGAGTSLDAIIRDLNSAAVKNLPADSSQNTHVWTPCKPGPWGNVVYRYIYLEAPEALVAHFPMPNSVPRWCFPGWTQERVRALFEKAGLPQSFQSTMLSRDHLVDEDGLLTVFPPLNDLEAMTADQRSVIYLELSQYDQNPFHKDPVLITSGSFEDWLKGTTMRPEFTAEIKKFLYKRGEALALSDLRALLNYAKSDAEAHDFFKLITRTRTLIARLVVKDAADLKPLSSYWDGPSQRNRDVLPILESSLSTEGPSGFDIIHFLPALARKNLYTFPTVDLALLGRIPDCHWTSLNFFNYNPKDYYLNTRLAADQVLQSYNKVSEPYEFGDVLMFMDDTTGQAIHSCVMIADDIVYTKNGDNLVTPWVLMKLDEVKKIYFHHQHAFIQGFRLKDLPN